jgi:hypothetical protein
MDKVELSYVIDEIFELMDSGNEFDVAVDSIVRKWQLDEYEKEEVRRIYNEVSSENVI